MKMSIIVLNDFFCRLSKYKNVLSVYVIKAMKQSTLTQLIFTCSSSTIETLEKGVKYVQSQH